jgi:antitoxin component of MazEF toxin-antitoxin module
VAFFFLSTTNMEVNMRGIINRNPTKAKTLPIPAAILAVSGLKEQESVEFHAGDNTVVLLPAKMTVMELVGAIHTLHEMTVNLLFSLMQSCGSCEDCGLCESMGLESQESVTIPAHVLEEAGLPPGCKLTACVDEGGNILVEQAAYEHDLSDVPAHILEAMRNSGACLADLEDRIMMGEIVYNGEEDTPCAWH